jgi:hypothetical protein
MSDSTLIDTTQISSDSPVMKVLLGVIGSLITFFLTNYLRERWKNRLHIKQITKSNDKDLFKFYDLYETVFREEVRISSEQFANWIDIDKKDSTTKKVSHFHFVCKRGSDVIGFLKVMYCWENDLLFIAYYAIDKKDSQARELASTTMIKHIEKMLKKKIPKCKGIVFELEDIDSGTTEEINTERKARIRLFKSAVKSRGHCAYEIECNYIQPQIKIDERDSSTDLPLVLMYISLYQDCSISLKLNKIEVMNILNFIYMNIYLPYFNHSGEDASKSEEHMLELLEAYHKNLPSRVPLKV